MLLLYLLFSCRNLFLAVPFCMNHYCPTRLLDVKFHFGLFVKICVENPNWVKIGEK